MEKLEKCPICSGECKLIQLGYPTLENSVLIRKFKIICTDCGLQTKDLTISVSIEADGEVKIEDEDFKHNITLWNKGRKFFNKDK